MNVLIFNGSIDNRSYATSNRLAHYFKEQFSNKHFSPEIFSLSDSQIPFFDQSIAGTIPEPVQAMSEAFRKADLHIWLTPLYHGGMTGAMKNCLDWLEVTSKQDRPYLTGKVVALVSWADGTQAMQGINAMDAVAKALRAWVLPFSIPILKDSLYDPQTQEFTAYYKTKFDTLVQLLATSRAQVAS